MSAWRLVAEFGVVPALVLTALVVVPTPRVVKKGLLQVTRTVLDFRVAGNFKLVWVMIAITGMAYAACCVHTYKLSLAVVDDLLTPNQKTALLAKKWREERNHWIALLAFVLWGCLNRFHTLMSSYLALLEREQALHKQVAALTSQLLALQGSGGAGVPPQQAAPPSAPPAPPAVGAQGAEDALAAAAGGGLEEPPAAVSASVAGLVNRGAGKGSRKDG